MILPVGMEDSGGEDSMKLPRQFLIIAGSALVAAAIAMAGLSFSTGGTHALAGGLSPEPTADPTIDPCLVTFGESVGSELVMAQQDPCITPTEETPPKTHTPTAEPTDAPDPTEPPTTATVAPPAATNTPFGGAGAGGLQPPNTGTGSGDSSSMQFLLMAGGLVALVSGAGALGLGLRKK
jgi:hypothetical protein